MDLHNIDEPDSGALTDGESLVDAINSQFTAINLAYLRMRLREFEEQGANSYLIRYLEERADNNEGNSRVT